jgi:hypothetical protein
MMGAFGDGGDPDDEHMARGEQDLPGLLPELIVDRRRTAYPFLRRLVAAHLRDVGDFVALDQPDAARNALQMALAVRAEIEVAPGDHR